MRLRDVRALLKDNLGNLSPSFVGLNGSMLNFENRETVRTGLIAIANVPSLSPAVRNLLKNPAFTSDSSVIESSRQGGLQQQAREISATGAALLNFLSEILPEEPDGYFTLRLPRSTYSPSALRKEIQSLSLAFEQPIQRVFRIPAQVTLAEPGSLLLELGVLATAGVSVNQVLKFVGRLLDLGIARAKLTQERAIEQQELAKVRQENAKAQLDEIRADQAARQNQLEIQRLENTSKMAELRISANELETDTFAAHEANQTEEPNETIPIIRNAVSEIAELHASAATFELQLNAPPDVISCFPKEARPSNADPALRLLSEDKVRGLLTS